MFNARQFVETGKNIIILLLTAGILLLSMKSGLIAQAFDLFRSKTPMTDTAGDTVSPGIGGNMSIGYIQAAIPLAIAVTANESSRYGVKYSADVKMVYSRFSVNLGEALGSSGNPERISASAWEEALKEPGVFFDFQYEQDLSALMGWLGGGAKGGVSGYRARRLCLARGGDRLSLYFVGNSDSEYYRSETALVFTSSIMGAIAEFPDNGARFAFELPENTAGLDPNFLFLGSMPVIYGAIALNPETGGDTVQSLLRAFGMNAYIQPAAGGEGSVEYVENEFRLRLFPNGEARFRREPLSDASGGIRVENKSVPEAVAVAGALALRVTDAFCGEADVTLTGLAANAENTGYIVRFDYVLNGILVRLAEAESAVVIEIVNGAVSGCVIRLREYRITDEPLLVLPEIQEAGIVTVAGGGEPVLMYYDKGESVNVRWFIEKGLGE